MSVSLRHFRPQEFGDWWPHMHPVLLRRLDRFRDRLGVPVVISPAPGALGRRLGAYATSRHNIDRWGTVQAADVMPLGGLDLRQSDVGRRVVELATACGFGGIGVYLGWTPHPGLHLDIRPLKPDGRPATWTRIDGRYLALDRAWAAHPDSIA